MNLHANAALSWTGRRRLCELVVDQGWTVTAAAVTGPGDGRAARTLAEEPHPSSVLARTRGRLASLAGIGCAVSAGGL
jgi:hypothetical protein